MTLEEFLQGKSIWGGILGLAPFPFTDEAEKMDRILVLSFGNRKLYSKIANLEIEQISSDIVLIYANEWNNLIDLDKQVKDALAGNLRKVTETIKNKENRVTNRDDVNKVSAYDTDILVDNDGVNSKVDDDLTGDKERIFTEQMLIAQDAFQNLSLTQKHNIIKSVTKDVADYLTLSIY